MIVLLILLFSLKRTIKKKYESYLINSKPVITVGEVTKYIEIGIANYYLTYEYEVENKKFHKEVIPNLNFKNCQHDDKCIGRKIFIKYYANDFSISEPIFDSLPRFAKE
jgi:hypothetical protein